MQNTMLAVSLALVGMSHTAFAGEPETDASAEKPAEKPAVAAEASAEGKTPATPSAAEDQDGVRFRGGISGGGGAEIVLNYGTAGMGGI